MYSLDVITVTDFKDEFVSKVQNVEPEKLIEYCYSINESATESARTVSNGVKTIFTKLLSNVFEERGYNGDNPLLVDLVVRNILSYLSPKDLCSCRQVCRLWNQEAKIFFRRKQRIVFHPESIEKMEAFIRQMSIEECSEEDSRLLLKDDWTYYLSRTKKHGTTLIPSFTSYCFSAQFQCTQFPRTLMQDFAIICGQYVRKLEIFYPDDGSLNAQEFMAFFITGMPNLESVHFVNLPRKLTRSSFLRQLTEKDNDNLDMEYSINNYDDGRCITGTSNSNSLVITNYNCLVKELTSVTQLRIDRTWQMETCWTQSFLEDLFLLMPNLQDFELWTWNCTTEDEHSKPYLMSLSQRQKDNLRVLRPGSIGDDLGVHITELGLKLSKLYLPVLNRNISVKTIELLLQNQQNTLEELQLNCSTMQDSRLVEFPRMSKLKQLHMIITYPWNNDYTVCTLPISYEEQFPSLEGLKLELAIYNDLGVFSYFFPRSKTVSDTLIELDLSFTGFRDDMFISTLAEMFPNLKRFKLDGYGSKIFSSVCMYLQNLQQLELHLIYGFNVDDQITGIPKEECSKLRKKISSGETNFSSIEDDAIQTHPSLCSLTGLHKLAIRQKDYQAKFWPEAQCISSLTAYFALSQMKQLRHLQIESVKFTPECSNYLRHALEDCWLEFI